MAKDILDHLRKLPFLTSRPVAALFNIISGPNSLQTRDRTVSVALGRPFVIHSQDIDVGQLTEADFFESQNPNSLALEPANYRRSKVDFTTYSPAHTAHIIGMVQMAQLCWFSTFFSRYLVLPYPLEHT